MLRFKLIHILVISKSRFWNTQNAHTHVKMSGKGTLDSQKGVSK